MSGEIDTATAATADPSFALRTPAAIVLAGFVLTRVLGYVAGVRSDSSFLHSSWQVLDLRWLREDLLDSLINLHSQPPLFNLTVGFLAAVTPGHEGPVLQALHLVLGALLGLAMLDLLRSLGVSAIVATCATLMFVMSPASLLYENWLSYSYPIAAGLLIGAWTLHRYATRRTIPSGILAFSIIALPVLTWSLFHTIWLALVVILVTVLTRDATSRTMTAAAIPLVVVMAWYGKNLVLFGQPTASTWFGQSAFRAVTGGLSPEERRQLVAETSISDLAAVRTFSPLDAYRPYIRMPELTGSPALDDAKKQDGKPNFNHLAYIAVSQKYLELAMELVSQRPDLYMGTVTRGVCISFLPSTDYWALEANRAAIHWGDRVYNLVVYGQFRTPRLDSGCNIRTPAQFPFLFPLLLLTSVLGPAWLAVRSVERPELRVTMAFVATTIAWVMLVGNLFEFGENNRFRFVTEPLMWVGLSVTVHRGLTAWHRRRTTSAAFLQEPDVGRVPPRHPD